MSDVAAIAPPKGPEGTARQITIRALLLGERLDTSGLERSDLIASSPLAFRVGGHGFAALFRFGVAVFAGLTPVEEDGLLAQIRPRIARPFAKAEEETAIIQLASDQEDHVPPGGPIHLRSLLPEKMLVIADALAKSVVLARDEREVAAVFDVIEPLARRLGDKGSFPVARSDMLKLIGKSLRVQHSMSGRVAVEEKPDALWERPDLERLYGRLEDEYELKERAVALTRKLDVIKETATAFTDLIDTRRSLRLEWAIVLLIVSEIALTLYQIFFSKSGH
ncbi:RMD1 family protein [Terrarubrum flagellatum]|uniref:RMD1 family protein n=1 Tax=Terrirubrum flagellatum TaxID=2895980 RepID=UPI00314517A6